MLLAAKADPKSREAREQLKEIKALLKEREEERAQTLSWGNVSEVRQFDTPLCRSKGNTTTNKMRAICTRAGSRKISERHRARG